MWMTIGNRQPGEDAKKLEHVLYIEILSDLKKIQGAYYTLGCIMHGKLQYQKYETCERLCTCCIGCPSETYQITIATGRNPETTDRT